MADDSSPSQDVTLPPDGTPGLASAEPAYRAIGAQHAAGWLDTISIEHLQKAFVAASTEAGGAFMATALQNADKLAVLLGKALELLEVPVLPMMAGFAAPIVAGMFGADVDAGAFADRANTGGRSAAARAMVDAFLSAITADAPQPSEPGPDGALRVATAGLQAALEGWFSAAIPEIASDIVPMEMGHFSAIARLPEEIISALGIGRLVRTALRPLVDATATQPMKWAANTTYRPTHLGASTVARQVARGRWTKDQALAELAQEGYSDERIEALLNEVAKFLTSAELDLLTRAEQMTRDEAIQHLRDQGYEPELAATKMTLEAATRIETFEKAMADAAVTAYADGRVDSGVLGAFTQGVTIDAEYGNQLRELAEARRTLRATPLTPAEAMAAVKAGILAVSDYRAALETAGRTPDAIDVLELLLRKELDDKAALDTLRAQQAADKAKAARAKADAAAAAKAAVDAKAALARRGSATELSRAVVRGIVPIARLEEILNASFDADTVGIYVADVEQQRQDYLAQQQKAADATQRAAQKSLSVGELTDALYANVLTLDQVRASLAAGGLAPADVDVLVATLSAKKADHDAALATRTQAAAAAKAKAVSLSTVEQLVRRGSRTIAQYDALLASLGFDDAARAAMDELLQDKIADDRKAAQTRAGVASADPTKGLTLEQARRAAILGLTTVDDFQTFLINAGYTTDAQIVLLGELRDDVASADAARQKRAATGSVVGSRTLPLATVAQAARLGIITTDVYQQRLVDAGYSADDVALELDLLVTELTNVQAARTNATAASSAAAAKGLTLGQVEHAVKAGAATVDDYRARAVALGLGPDDVNTLVAVLDSELATMKDAKALHDQIAATLATQGTSLTDLDDAVRAGTLTIDAYQGQLVALGYSDDDAEFLGSLLVNDLTPDGSA